MTARTRVLAMTVTAAVLAAGGAVAVGALQGDRPGSAAAPTVEARLGRPPLALDLGVRDDAEARDLRRGEELYSGGKLADARRLFGAHDSLESRVGAAFAAWPDGTLDRLNRLAGLHPKSAVVQLHLGLALYWLGEGGAADAWQTAARVEPDTSYAVTADTLLYPRFAPKLPVFVPSSRLPARFALLPRARQLLELERQAKRSVDGRLHYGAALQGLGHQVSAEKVFREAAALAPADPEAQVAAAVGLFDKAAPAKSFSKLGPLTRRFPRAATVRFHLGVLLLWSGSVTEAKRQFRLAQSVEPGSPLAREAKKYLASLAGAGA